MSPSTDSKSNDDNDNDDDDNMSHQEEEEREVMDSLVTATQTPAAAAASKKKRKKPFPTGGSSPEEEEEDGGDDSDDDDDDDDDDTGVATGTEQDGQDEEAADDEEDENDSAGETKPSPGDTSATAASASASASSKASKKKQTTKKASPASASTAATPGNGSKAKSASKPRKRGPSGNSYLELVHQAIVALKDRTGSSLPAIKKYFVEHHKPQTEAGGAIKMQPAHFEKRQNQLINQALKKGVDTGRFTKVRASYKISSEFKKAKKAQADRAKKAAATAAANAKKKRAAVVALQKKQEQEGGEGQEDEGEKQPASSQEEKVVISAAEQARRQATWQRKKEAERVQKERAERIKRRKFPMEDTKLHLEDIELQVKPPTTAGGDNAAVVGPRPTLPYFWQGLRHVVPDAMPPKTKKTSDLVLRNSRVDGLDVASRGLIPDLLQVYHFFRGDVHFGVASVVTNGSSSSGGGGGGGRGKKNTQQQQQQDQQQQAWTPEFGLHHLVHAAAEILNGNAKRSRLVPPLISHCFVTCLQILLNQHDNNATAAETTTSTITSTAGAASSSSSALPQSSSSEPSVSACEAKFHKDLQTYLAPALTPASWSDVCFLYMDAMERFYSTDASYDAAVLQPLESDIHYLLGVSKEPTFLDAPMTPCPKKSVMNESSNGGAVAADAAATSVAAAAAASSMPLPDGYTSYLGDARGALGRAYDKLGRLDPWLLTAEEIFALLRALTDDVLASNHPLIGRDMAAREEKMQELSKAKRAADFKFRKIRLAYEGPKRPNRSKPATTSAAAVATSSTDNKAPDSNNSKGKTGNGNSENENGKNGTTSDAVVVQPFKPTATKKQFEAALRAQQKASDAYEKGIRTLVARTEPVGYDRDFNAVYCFRHDPDVLYVEDLRSPAAGNLAEHLPLEFQPQRRCWHVIAKTSLFDLFLGSLDLRGKRENHLYEELMGPFGQQRSLRRHLHDDLKIKAEAAAKVKEMEGLKKRLQSARIKCDEERGRRSGRLADAAEDELAQVQQEIDQLQRTVKEEKTATTTETLDYQDLTGLHLLRKFDFGGGRAVETRRIRQKQAAKASSAAAATLRPQMPCSKLVPTGNIDGTGAVGLLVSKLLEIEEMCESLAPWERTDVARSTWISKLESSVHAWYTISPFHVGPLDPATTESNGVSRSNSIGYSPGSANGSVTYSKRRRTESPGTLSATTSGSAPSIASVVNSIRQPLLDLEARVADLSNVSVSTRDADLADENMSTDGSTDDDEAEKARLEGAWKKIIHRLRNTHTKRHVQIRQLVVSAISSARQAHLPEVVASLRSALLLYHPNAAGECKTAAIKVLVAHGDYNGGGAADGDDDDADDVGDESLNNEDRVAAAAATNSGNNNEQQEEDIPSVLCTEAAMLRSSLDGSDDASRLDWIETAKSCKTISRLASLTAAFCLDATEKIQEIQFERDTFISVLEVWKRQDRKNNKATAVLSAGPSEVWANVRFTDEICMAKAEDWPWWPARICVAKDPGLAASLKDLNRTLIALVGEGGGLRVVRTNDQILPFTGNPITSAEIARDDNDKASASGDAASSSVGPTMTKEIRGQLKDCLAMTRRILRGQEKAAAVVAAKKRT